MVHRIGLRLAAVLLALTLAVVPGCLDDLGRVQNARTGPGDAALDFLTDKKYKKLVVEIDSVEGYGPNAEALQRLKDALGAHLRKPDGITYDTSGRVPGKGANAKYSFKEVDALEEKHRDHYASGDTAVLYVIYLDGGSTDDDGDSRVLGAAYHGSSLVMFKGNVKAATSGSGGLLGATRPSEGCVERAVIVHELGHALGLVNHGIRMVRDHEDPEHRGHSSNKKSVMYFAVNNSLHLFNVFTGGCSSIPHQFDDDDKADLKAAGGK